jgi:hypothetical protein
MKKFRLSNPNDKDALIETLINKQLEKYNLTVNSPEIINNKKWFSTYCFDNHDEYLRWKNFCIEILSKHCIPKMYKKEVEKQFNWIDLMWGLKQNYNTVITSEDGKTVTILD